MSQHDPDKREGTAVSFPVSGGDGHRKLDKSDDTYHYVNHSGARLLNKFGVLKGYPPHKGEEREKWDSFWDRIEGKADGAGLRSDSECREGAERSDERSTDQASDDRGTTEGPTE